jgi:cyclase
MNRLTTAMFGLISCLMVLNPCFAQQPTELKAEKISDNIYAITGGVANTAFIIGSSEVLAIDAQMTADGAAKMIDLIEKTTPKPLTKMVLTHSDGDHINGIGGFPKGLEIYASEGTKKEMEEAFKAPQYQALNAYLPTRTFSDSMEIDLGTERIRLLHFGPAHTSGDTVVFFPGSKTAFVGDLVFLGRDPLIHRSKGGTCLGLIHTLQEILKLDAEKFIPGHNNVLSRNDVQGLLDSVEEKVAKVRTLVQEGKSLEETKAAFGIEPSPAKPGGFSFPSLVEVIYLELSGG